METKGKPHEPAKPVNPSARPKPTDLLTEIINPEAYRSRTLPLNPESYSISMQNA